MSCFPWQFYLSGTVCILVSGVKDKSLYSVWSFIIHDTHSVLDLMQQTRDCNVTGTESMDVMWGTLPVVDLFPLDNGTYLLNKDVNIYKYKNLFSE
jgi:hypothetical protein